MQFRWKCRKINGFHSAKNIIKKIIKKVLTYGWDYHIIHLASRKTS